MDIYGSQRRSSRGVLVDDGARIGHTLEVLDGRQRSHSSVQAMVSSQVAQSAAL